MEYDFKRNALTGTLTAHFSMGHELLGYWFSELLGEDIALIDDICIVITKLHQHQLVDWCWSAKGVTIELDSEQVRVFADEVEGEHGIDFDGSLSFYGGEIEAFCGLEDFELALLSWREFIHSN